MAEQPLTHGLDQYGRRRLVQVVVTLSIALGIYFLAAGRADLAWGWVYLGIGVVSLVGGGWYILRHNPQVINERGRPAENQKTWDKIILAIYTPLFVAVYIVAGLDARFGWSEVMPLWLHLVGVLISFSSMALTYSAMAHNKFLAQVVQIADQRGHRVATEGPYHYIRHPMYASLILSWPALAFVFGSYWALVPAGLAALMILIRTILEDRTLLAELPGYKEYAQKTPYRLLPGVW
jgi:protein-S-isoprenylcysteine O-methyltransferase Ste14